MMTATIASAIDGVRWILLFTWRSVAGRQPIGNRHHPGQQMLWRAAEDDWQNDEFPWPEAVAGIALTTLPLASRQTIDGRSACPAEKWCTDAANTLPATSAATVRAGCPLAAG
jgi:hypothetical protein